MKCPNCNSESNGKFCQNCGVRLLPYDEFDTVNIDEPIRGNDTYSGELSQPAAKPAEAGGSAHKGSKTAIVITAIIAGAMAVIAIVFCVVVCTLVNAAPELIEKAAGLSSSVDQDADAEVIGEADDNDGIWYDAEDYNEDSTSMLAYQYSTAYDGIKIVSVADGFYDKYEAAVSDSGEVTVEVPAQIDGKDVVEIESLPIYIDTAESVKLILPDTVKIIRAYALSFTDNLTEVQLGSGLVSIGDSAFIGDTSLNEITIPSSVTSLDACGLGIYYNENGSEKKNSDFVVYGQKGSAAEAYASQYGFTFKETE